MPRIAGTARGLFGLASVFGAAVFIALTALLWTLFYENISVARVPVFILLAFVIFGLARPATRQLSAGFVLAFAIMTPLNSRFTQIWWIQVTREVGRVTQPVMRWKKGIEQKRTWVNARRGYPLEVRDALVLLDNLHTGCVPSYNPPAAEADIPADVAAIFRKTDCDRFEPMLVTSSATYPARYYPSDTGWRWDYARTDRSTGGFRVVLRPDPALELPGPTIEITGDGQYRIRASETAPLTMLRTPVPMMKRLRECIPLAAASVDPKYYPILWEYLSNASYLRRVCRELFVDEEQDSKAGDRVILVTRIGETPDPLGPTMLHYRALSPGRFEIRSWSFGRRYLLDADGKLHAASALGPGVIEDGPPAPCELEPGKACT